jgi:hypothetical protein
MQVERRFPIGAARAHLAARGEHLPRIAHPDRVGGRDRVDAKPDPPIDEIRDAVKRRGFERSWPYDSMITRTISSALPAGARGALRVSDPREVRDRRIAAGQSDPSCTEGLRGLPRPNRSKAAARAREPAGPFAVAEIKKYAVTRTALPTDWVAQRKLLARFDA